MVQISGSRGCGPTKSANFQTSHNHIIQKFLKQSQRCSAGKTFQAQVVSARLLEV